MTQEQFNAWVAALRSNKYIQGEGALCRLTPDGLRYCCLGVYAEVNDLFTDTRQDLTGKLKKFVGNLPDWLPHELINEDDQCFLAAKNDSGSTFEQIADILETQEEKYVN